MRLARTVIETTFGIATLLLVFWVIGVATTHPTPAGLAAVGAGIHATLVGFVQILSGL